jgi:hypothetical protein
VDESATGSVNFFLGPPCPARRPSGGLLHVGEKAAEPVEKEVVAKCDISVSARLARGERAD